MVRLCYIAVGSNPFVFDCMISNAFISSPCRHSIPTPTQPGGPKVYDVSSYLDDHPGGAEVMLDVSGQDADEFFEDIGHSNDAREELTKYLVGTLKMDEEEKKRRAAAAEKAKAGGGGPNVVLILAVVAAVAFGYYKTQIASSDAE